MEEGALVDVEIDGDPDLFIAARDFSRIADSQQKVCSIAQYKNVHTQNCVMSTLLT